MSRRITRVVTTGAVALTAVFALVAAHANPGRKAATTVTPAYAAPTVDPFGGLTDDPGLAPPATAPRASQSQVAPSVVSGGS